MGKRWALACSLALAANVGACTWGEIEAIPPAPREAVLCDDTVSPDCAPSRPVIIE